MCAFSENAVIEFDVFNKGDRSPDLTPMIDMVFLLLIFFLLTSVFRSTAVETDLPESTTAMQSDPQSIVISVKQNGEVYYNDEQVSMQTLKYLLRYGLEETREKEVSIASDKGVDFARIISLMDIARDSGAESVSFLTEHEK